MSNSEPSIDKLLLRLEKIESKFDVLSDFEKSMNERISDLSERIGELRSMVMGRERSMDEVESDVVKVKDIIHELEPGRYLRDLEKQKKSSVELNARLEKLEDSIHVTREEMKRARDKLDKLGDLHSLSKFYKDIEKRSAEIDDRVMRVRQLTSKTESIFVELSEKLPELDNMRRNVDSLQDIVEDVMKDSDIAKIKLEKLENMGLIPKEITDEESPWMRERFNELNKKLIEEIERKFSEMESADSEQSGG